MVFHRTRANPVRSAKLPFSRKLAGDSGADLGGTREISDRVVARGLVRVAQVEHEKFPSRHGRLDVAAGHQGGIALGVEHNHYVATTDVLGDEHLGEARFTHPGGAQHHHVPWSLDQIHADFGFVRLQAMYDRVAAERRQRRNRIPPNLLVGLPRQPARAAAASLVAEFEPARPGIQSRLGDVAAVLGIPRQGEALGVALIPFEPETQEQAALRSWDFTGLDDVFGQSGQVALKPGYTHALP